MEACREIFTSDSFDKLPLNIKKSLTTKFEIAECPRKCHFKFVFMKWYTQVRTRNDKQVYAIMGENVFCRLLTYIGSNFDIYICPL